MMRLFGMLAATGVLAGALLTSSSPVLGQPGGFGKGGFGKGDFKKEGAKKDNTAQLQAEIEKLQAQVKELQAALAKKGKEAGKRDTSAMGFGGLGGIVAKGGKFDADNIKIFIERVMQEKDVKKGFEGKKAFEGKKGFEGGDSKKKFEEKKKEAGGKIDRDELRSMIERILNEREGKKGGERKKGFDGKKKEGFGGGPKGFGRPSPEASRTRGVEARIDRIIGELESLRKELKRK